MPDADPQISRRHIMAKRVRIDTAREAALRDWNKILGLWRVCDNSACRRARCCRGDVRACAPGNFALAPEGVQGWFCCLLSAKEEKLSFDEALARLQDTPADAAFRAWHAGGRSRGARRAAGRMSGA
jgi:hypothetical protein